MTTPARLAANRRNAQKSTGPQTPEGREQSRRNGARSHGPRTPEGKARSRYNALKHGILARAVIPPALEGQESPEEFAALVEDLRQELAPATPLETLLVDTVAACHWRLARLLRVEGGEIASRRAGRERIAADDSWIKSLMETVRIVPGRPAEPGPPGPENPEEAARQQALVAAECSLPAMHIALSLLRYEAHLELQIFRALALLERLQARRAAAPPAPALPPPAEDPA